MGNKTKSSFLFVSPRGTSHPPPSHHLIEEAISIKQNANQFGCYGNWGGGERERESYREMSSVFLSSVRETDLRTENRKKNRTQVRFHLLFTISWLHHVTVMSSHVSFDFTETVFQLIRSVISLQAAQRSLKVWISAQIFLSWWWWWLSLTVSDKILLKFFYLPFSRTKNRHKGQRRTIFH